MMKYFLIFCCLVPALVAAQEYHLAPPKIMPDSIFFLQHSTVRLAFALDGAAIHFTTDGSLPVQSSPVYNAPLSLSASSTITAISRHPEYIASKPARVQMIKAGFLPDTTRLLVQPDTQYTGRGGNSLSDLQKGGSDLHDGRWLGFRGDTVEAEFVFSKPVSCRQIVVSTLSDPGSWIFPPRRIDVYGETASGTWQHLGNWKSNQIYDWKQQSADYALYREVEIKQIPARRFKLKVIPYGYLPADHPGAGAPAWLFLDEVIFQ